MNTYRCAPDTTVATVASTGDEVIILFDKDGTYQTDDLGLIVVLDALAADPNSPVESGSAARRPAVMKPDKDAEEDIA